MKANNSGAVPAMQCFVFLIKLSSCVDDMHIVGLSTIACKQNIVYYVHDVHLSPFLCEAALH